MFCEKMEDDEFEVAPTPNPLEPSNNKNIVEVIESQNSQRDLLYSISETQNSHNDQEFYTIVSK